MADGLFVYMTGNPVFQPWICGIDAACLCWYHAGEKIPAKIGVPAEAGPSATISPSLFDFGVDCIAGFYITDIDLARSMVSQAAHREIFRSGNRIRLSKEEISKRT